MGIWKKQGRILTAFGVFLALMFLCTLISRAVYASGLPQVTVDVPRRMALNHNVEAEGIVRQGREYAVTMLPGLRVRTVYVHVGDRVTSETLLFDVDLDDLRTQIQEQELAVKKLKLQIADMEKNRSLDVQKRQMENARAWEDYDRTASAAGETLRRAEENLSDAKDALEELRNHPVSVTSEKERKAQQAAYETWKEKEAELKKAAEDAKKAYEALKGDQEEEKEAVQEQQEEEKEAAWEQYEAAEKAYEDHLANEVVKPDFSGEDAARTAWEEKKEALKSDVESAERSVEDARRSQADAMTDAGRKVTDAAIEDNADSSLEISRLELNVMQSDLEDCKKILESGGEVYPEVEGIITRIQVNPGERTADGAAIVYADLSSPMQFNVSLTKAQKKYVNQDDQAELVLGGYGMEVNVDYVAENEMNPELYDVYVFLPSGAGTIGESGSFTVKAQSETFSCCIPIAALHEDSNKRNFVYIVSEKSGILGTELAAEMVYVKVLDQNDSYAAIEEGVIGSDTELIVSSTEVLEDREVIRYKE